MRRWTLIAIVGAGLAACGGHKPATSDPGTGGGGETPNDGGDSGGMTSNPCSDSGMCPPETLERIKEVLDSHRLSMSRCLDEAVSAGQAEKNAKGKVTVDFVIATSGKAKNVKVGSSTIKAKSVEDCVVAKVGELAFPEVPKDLDWSYTYAFESN